MPREQPTAENLAVILQKLSPTELQVVADALAALKKAPIDKCRFLTDFWGITVEEETPGRWRGHMPIRPQILNRQHIVHGGATYTLADSLMGYAVWRRYQGTMACVTVEIKITYVAPGRGEELVAEVQVLRAGQTLAYTDCRVLDDTGRLVAVATGTFYVWDPSQPLPD